MQTLIQVLLIVTAIFMIMLVLVQRGRGGGLAGALGGMGGQSAFGTKAGDTFTRITIGTAAVWILLCVVAVKVVNTQSSVFQGADSSLPGMEAEPGSKTKPGDKSKPGTKVEKESGTAPKTDAKADKPADTKPAESTKAAESKPADTKPAETKPAETKPADTKPAESAPKSEKE